MALVQVDVSELLRIIGLKEVELNALRVQLAQREERIAELEKQRQPDGTEKKTGGPTSGG